MRTNFKVSNFSILKLFGKYLGKKFCFYDHKGIGICKPNKNRNKTSLFFLLNIKDNIHQCKVKTRIWKIPNQSWAMFVINKKGKLNKI